MDNTELSKKIESILFVSGSPMTVRELAKYSNAGKKETEAAIEELESNLLLRGLKIMKYEDKISLVTSPECSETISSFLKEELRSDLSRSSLETLTIILYKSPVSRSTIDYIRGVNSSYTLHVLLTRGMIERNVNPKDSRAFLYKPSPDFLKYAGITKMEDLPDFSSLKEMRTDEISGAENLNEKELLAETEHD